MARQIYQATAGGGTLDASALGAEDTAIMRGANGDDTLIGGAGADMISVGNGHNVVNAGGGDDLIFTALSPYQSNTIDGGAGHDTLTIAMTAAQLATTAVHDALVALNSFMTYTLPGNPAAHFVNSTLGLDMTGVEVAQVRVGSTLETLDAAGAHAVAPPPPTSRIDFEDLLVNTGRDQAYLTFGYKGFDWRSDPFPTAYLISVHHDRYDFPDPSGEAGSSSWRPRQGGDTALFAESDFHPFFDEGDPYAPPEPLGPLVITKHGGGDFHFTGLDFIDAADWAASYGRTDVTITGTHGGTTVGTHTQTAYSDHWSSFSASWGTIDKLTISWTQDSFYGHTWDAVAIDNIWLG